MRLLFAKNVKAVPAERNPEGHTSSFTGFKTLEDHEVYQDHPLHKKFIETYSALWAKVRVYDADIVHTQ